MERPWLDILLDKIKELGEDPTTLEIDGDLRNIHQDIWQYDWGGYDNIDIKIAAYTKNYVYFDEVCQDDNYQKINVIPRNPTGGAWNYEEIMGEN